jgi:hypothetical protein
MPRVAGAAATTLAAAVAGAAAAALTLMPDDGARAASSPGTVTVQVGDRVVVAGQPLGCRVERRGDRAVVDCRRGGPLAGTYGTRISARRAQIVRFRSDTVAKVVYTATHQGGARRCQ